MIDLGQMDRYGVIYRRTKVVGASGAISYTETKVGDVYLSQVSIPINTVIVAMKDTEQTDVIWKGRWLDGVENGMLLKVEGVTYRITRREELGRREGIRIYARAL